MVKEASSDLYSLILERIFFKHFHEGTTSVWKREELLEAAKELDVRAPKNLGDLVYAFRYRRRCQWVVAMSSLNASVGVR